jgi:uncharacterized protein YqeY
MAKSKFLDSLGIESTGEFGPRYRAQLKAFCAREGVDYEGYSLDPADGGKVTVYVSRKYTMPLPELLAVEPLPEPAKKDKPERKQRREVTEGRVTNIIKIDNKNNSKDMTTEELKKQLDGDLKGAMRAGDKKKVSALRLIKASIETAEKAEGRTGEVDWMKVLGTESKKRMQAAEAFRQGGAAEKEEQELYERALIESFLPAKQTEEETAAHLASLKAELGVGSPKEMGKLIKEFQTRFPGLQDGATVSRLAKALLTT